MLHFTSFKNKFLLPLHHRNDIFHTAGLALRGYDMVTLFRKQQIAKGNKKYRLEYQGLDWLFESEENKAAFAERPEAYLPEFGGYCAWGASNGYKAATKIDTFSFINGKLYFNFSSYIREHWIADAEHFIAKARQNWPTTAGEEPIKANPTIIYLKYLIKGKRFFE